jgi:hypothetical protein
MSMEECTLETWPEYDAKYHRLKFLRLRLLPLIRSRHRFHEGELVSLFRVPPFCRTLYV